MSEDSGTSAPTTGGNGWSSFSRNSVVGLFLFVVLPIVASVFYTNSQVNKSLEILTDRISDTNLQIARLSDQIDTLEIAFEDDVTGLRSQFGVDISRLEFDIGILKESVTENSNFTFPDYISQILSVYVPEPNVVIGETIPISINIAAIGLAGESAEVVVETISDNATPGDISDDLVIGSVTVILEAGTSSTETFEWDTAVADINPGPHILVARNHNSLGLTSIGTATVRLTDGN